MKYHKNQKIMKKLLLILLALPMLTTAQEKIVQVPPCVEGNSFTIRIPVKFPDSMTVQYAWYRNDTLIDGTHMLLLGEKVVAYIIPADKAFGSAVYHFTYRLHDDYIEWSRSPRYLVNFQTTINCPAIITSGAISVAATASCSGGVTSAGVVSVAATASCSNGVTSAGTVSVAATASCNDGVTSAGSISVTAN